MASRLGLVALMALVGATPVVGHARVAAQTDVAGIEVTAFTLAGGDVVVAEEDAGRVVRVRGTEVSELASGLASPRGVAIDVNGSVVVAEQAASRVLRLEARGVARVVVDGLSAPDDVVADGERVYVADPGSDRVIAVADGGSPETLTTDLPDPIGIDLLAGGRFAGRLVVAFRGKGDFDGRLAAVPRVGGATPAPINDAPLFERPGHVDADSSGLVYLSDEAGRVVADDGPSRRRVIAEGAPLVDPIGMAVDVGDGSSTTLLVTHDNALLRVDPASGRATKVVDLRNPAGLDVVPGRAGAATTTPTSTSTTMPSAPIPPTTTSTVPAGGARCGRRSVMVTLRREVDRAVADADRERRELAARMEREIQEALDAIARSELEAFQRGVEEALRALEGLRPQPPVGPPIAGEEEGLGEGLDEVERFIESMRTPNPPENADDLFDRHLRAVNEAIEALDAAVGVQTDRRLDALEAPDATPSERDVERLLGELEQLAALPGGALARRIADDGCDAATLSDTDDKDDDSGVPLLPIVLAGCALVAAGAYLALRAVRGRRTLPS